MEAEETLRNGEEDRNSGMEYKDLDTIGDTGE
jgi:hypothetical protein